MEIRLLTADDAENYQALRLQALREAPTAFSSSEADERNYSLETVAARIAGSLPENPTFGAFIDGALVGVIGLYRAQRMKTRHRGMIWGMYVAPHARCRGSGRSLLNALLDYARTLPDLEEVTLSVTRGNDTARRLYSEFGFIPFAVEPRYLKIDGQYYDIEHMGLRL